MLIEAKNIVNMRPITHVSIDPDSAEALTPNHFLVGSSNGSTAIGEFNDSDLVLRKKWRTCQRVADQF